MNMLIVNDECIEESFVKKKIIIKEVKNVIKRNYSVDLLREYKINRYEVFLEIKAIF